MSDSCASYATVVTPSGTPVVGSSVTLVDMLGATSVDVSNGSGEVSFLKVPEGSFAVTATDPAGHRYVFEYNNEFRVANTIAQPDIYSGTMHDAFSLAGNGPANLHNGFLAGITTDATLKNFSFPIDLASRGDPIEFPSGASHCDPL